MMDDLERPPITPAMKVADLLNHYPELEKVLMAISPAFAKLKNPVLRKTIAKVATLGQAAAVGSIKVADLINELRKAAGFDEKYEIVESDSYSETRPPWMENPVISTTFDARPLIEKGEQPLGAIILKLNELKDGGILELLAPFYPAPIIDKAKSMGFEVWSVKNNSNLTRSYFHKHG